MTDDALDERVATAMSGAHVERGDSLLALSRTQPLLMVFLRHWG